VGLVRFLTEVDNLAGVCAPKRVRIVSGIIDWAEADLVATVRELGRRLTRGGIRHLELALAPDHMFKKCLHGRYLRFDECRCLILDPGTEILEGSSLYRLSRYSIKDFEVPSRKERTKPDWKEQYSLY
jgi:hypothetical protein